MEYQLIRSSRKTIAIQIKPDGEVIVRAPKRLTMAEIRRFVAARQPWIQKHLPKQRAAVQKLTEAERSELVLRAKKLLPEKTAYYAPLVGVDYGKITIRSQHTRWGSCSSRGNLNFNCLLMLVPEAVLDYVVVHELCHRKQMNHSSAFWAEVEAVLPGYREPKRWLKDHGPELIARLPEE